MTLDFLTRQEDVPRQLAPTKPALSTMERAMVAIVGVSLGAACFLISSRHHAEAGHRPWRSGSVLQQITQLMSLNFEYPTNRGTEIKWLIQGLAGAAALMAGVIGWYIATKPQEPASLPTGVRPRRALRDRFVLFFSSATPTSAAQMAIVLFAGWTFVTALWAPWPAGAIGEAFRQLIPIVWAVVLGRTLRARGARHACLVLVGVLALTSVIGIWYYYERNPVQRLKFPIGNPIFLAACLLPALVLSPAWGAGWLAKWLAGHLKTSAGEERPRAPRVWDVSLWIVIGSLVCFALAVWASGLAGSRGPLVGLALGAAVLAGMAGPRLVRWSVIAVTLAGLIGALFYVSAHLDDEGSRWATIRFRTYAWKYAIDRFIARPVGGAGQGGYLLSAEAMKLEDAERDPIAFSNSDAYLGNAHNEWLQILSDLGAAGFALISTALGITFWGAGLAVRKLGGAMDRWCLLGLAGTQAAMIVEEMTDVAMRQPVFPLIFYTVLGLMWALTASAEKKAEESVEHSHAQSVRMLGLLLGGAAAAVMAWVSVADWQGARAQFRIAQRVDDKKDWDGALTEAAAAERLRLGIDDRVVAAQQAGMAAQAGALYWFGELNEILARARDQEGLSTGALRVAAENAAQFDRYYAAGMAAGERVLERMPYFPNVAGQLGGLVLMKSDKERIEVQLGLRKEVTPCEDEARHLLALEYARDPFNPELGLQLLAVTPEARRLDSRLNLLRVPIRAGPIHPGALRILAVLARDENFGAVIDDWMAMARKTLEAPTRSWADPYAPETLRLGALLDELRRTAPNTSIPEVLERADRAATMTQGAADLLLTIRARYPTAAAYARVDQARYRLWAVPNRPEEAVAVYRQALMEWPPYGPKNERDVLQAGLSTYLLAAGDEQQARENLRQLFPSAVAASLDELLVSHLERFGQWFILLPPQARPVKFPEQIKRLLELGPKSPVGHLMAAQLDLERGNDVAAMNHLETIRQMGDVSRYAQAVNFLAARFPENGAIQVLAERLFGTRQSQTRPATRPEPPDSRGS